MSAPLFSKEPLADRIAIGLGKIGLALKSQGLQAAGARGLTPLQGQVLTTLMTSRAGLKPSVLAERLAVSPATISECVKALQAKGAVERRADPDDARVSLVVLTAAGRVEAKAAAGWPDFLATAVEALSEEEQAVFFKGLLKLIMRLQQEGQIPQAQMCVSCRFFRPNVRAGARPHHCAFVDAPMAATELRLDCADHDPSESLDVAWRAFLGP